jgi:hypothetical protein
MGLLMLQREVSVRPPDACQALVGASLEGGDALAWQRGNVSRLAQRYHELYVFFSAVISHTWRETEAHGRTE